jgi:hypothetical protein
MVALLAFAAALISLGLTACATPERGASVPRELTSKATFLGISNARFTIGDQDELAAEYLASVRKEVAYRKSQGRSGPLPASQYLAISGGGDDGAYGAGLLVGWTARGDRPTFKAVTGVSTGALTAPLAFLGPDYDDALRTVYTKLGPSDIFERRPFWAAITDDALSDTSPLYATVARFVDDAMIARIAEEYAKGRLLFIMSTNLDTGAPVIWNIGAIAASGHPGARDLIMKLLLASSAMPAAFPPVMLDVEIDGQKYQEMHVDGGVVAQVFLYPPSIDLTQVAKEAGQNRKRDAYVIRNGRLIGDTSKVDRLTTSIAGRAVSTMIASSGMNDMQRIYTTTTRDGVGFHLAYIPPSFTVPYVGPFDTGYMNAVFDYGYRQAVAGNAWHSTAPLWNEE